MGKKSVLALALLSLTFGYISATEVICYHGTWSHYRAGNGQFSVSAVPANLCTIYIYAFVGLSATDNTVVLLDEWLDIGLSGFANAVALKNTNANLKVLLAVGGWSEGSAKYSVMAASATARATFIQSALELVQKYDFDGFDLDWEYPGKRDSTNTADKDNFSALVKEFRAAFDAHNLLVTAAVSAAPASVDISYDVPVLNENLDFINVMAYDFHGAWDSFTGHNAPLYSSARLTGTEYADYSTNAAITGWIERGADPSKLAMGVPFYGRTVLLSDSSNNAPGAATTSTGGTAGTYTQTAGFLGYNEIIEAFNAGGWTEAWDDEQQVPYAYNGNTWLTYDTPASIALKVEYAKSLGLGAIMLWSIETEDFLGLSGTTYPLLNAINTALGTDTSTTASSSDSTSSSETSTTTTTESTTEGTTASTTESTTASTTESTTASTTESSTTEATTSTTAAASETTFTCTAEGYCRDTSDCSKFYYCQLVSGTYTAHAFTCSGDLVYDTTTGTCNYASAVVC